MSLPRLVFLANVMSALTVRLPGAQWTSLLTSNEGNTSPPRLVRGSDKSEMSQRKYLTLRQKLFQIFTASYDRVAATQPDSLVSFYEMEKEIEDEFLRFFPSVRKISECSFFPSLEKVITQAWSVAPINDGKNA